MLKKFVTFCNLSLIIVILFGIIIIKDDKKTKEGFSGNENPLIIKKVNNEIILSSETSEIIYSYDFASNELELEKNISGNFPRKILTYKWYNIKINNNTSFISVNVLDLDNNYFDNKITVGIFIYKSNSGKYLNDEGRMFDYNFENENILELIQIENNNRNKLFKKFVILTDEVFNCISNISTNLSWDSAEKELEIIKESFSVENDFKSLMNNYNNSITFNHEQLCAELSNNQFVNTQLYQNSYYDKYTNSSGLLNDYNEIYKSKEQNENYFNSAVSSWDNAIVNIVPKSIFKSNGNYSYIGLKYGFFARTFSGYKDDKKTEIIVFSVDMPEIYPGNTQKNANFIKITPLISEVYNYSKYTEFVNLSFENPNLALSNIEIKLGVKNIDNKNYADYEYNPYNDYGYYFSSFAFEANMVGKKNNSSKISLTSLKLITGSAKFIIPGVTGNIISSVGVPLLSLIETNLNNKKDIHVNRGQNGFIDAKYEITNNNADSLINETGKLPKSISANINFSDNNFPGFYKIPGNYFKFNYSFSQRRSDINWNAAIAAQINLDIYKDTTGRVLFFDTGKIEKLGSINGGQIKSYNEWPENLDILEIKEDQTIKTSFQKNKNGVIYTYDENKTPSTGSYNDFYFTPEEKHLYNIETFNNMGDPYLKIYDDKNILLAKDDDSGVNRNSLIEITLEKEKTYRIRTSNYNYKSGLFYFIIKKSKTINEADYYSLNKESVNIKTGSLWYKFKPKFSDYYSIYTTGISDSYLELFDENYNKIAFDDDSGHSCNAETNILLLQNKTYYIKTRSYYNGSISFNLYVNRSRNLVILNGLTKNTIIRYNNENGKVNFFGFVPKNSGYYEIKTDLISGDPVVRIYNNSMNLIAENDDYNGLNSYVRIWLSAGEKYYFEVKSYYSSSANSTGNFIVEFK